MRMPPREKNCVSDADRTTGLLRKANGIIAPSPSRCSQNKKSAKTTAAPHSRPMTTELSQAYWFPPYSRANKSIIAAGLTRANPTRSSDLTAVPRTWRQGGLTVASGTLLKMRQRPTTAPMGRLT